jgi:hypothetical protein
MGSADVGAADAGAGASTGTTSADVGAADAGAGAGASTGTTSAGAGAGASRVSDGHSNEMPRSPSFGYYFPAEGTTKWLCAYRE